MNVRKMASEIRKAARKYYGPVRVEIGIRPNHLGKRVADQMRFATDADLWSTVSIEEALKLEDRNDLFVMDGYVYSLGPDGELLTNCNIWVVYGKFAGIVDSVSNKNEVAETADALGYTGPQAAVILRVAKGWSR